MGYKLVPERPYVFRVTPDRLADTIIYHALVREIVHKKVYIKTQKVLAWKTNDVQHYIFICKHFPIKVSDF